MTDYYDKGTVPAGPNPMQIASKRAQRFEEPIDRSKFLEAFMKGRVAEARGDSRAYYWYRAALDADDSATVAGLIEGAASVHQQERKVYRYAARTAR